MFKIAIAEQEIDIQPGQKGECFRNALKWASLNDDGKTYVVHGKITNVENKRFDHAWVEQGQTIIDPTAGVKYDKKQYYSIVQAQIEAAYTPTQANINMVRANNFGPWTTEEVGLRFTYKIDSRK